MSKNDNEHDDDFALFKDAVKGVKKLPQDTILQQATKNVKQKQLIKTARDATARAF